VVHQAAMKVCVGQGFAYPTIAIVCGKSKFYDTELDVPWRFSKCCRATRVAFKW
jgi:hypothetical protein